MNVYVYDYVVRRAQILDRIFRDGLLIMVMLVTMFRLCACLYFDVDVGPTFSRSQLSLCCRCSPALLVFTFSLALTRAVVGRYSRFQSAINIILIFCHCYRHVDVPVRGRS